MHRYAAEYKTVKDIRVHFMAQPKGKIIITNLNHKLITMLIRDNHILSIQVSKSDDHAVGNIYVGRVQNVSENIGAAFVDIGGGYLTFLPLDEAKYTCITNRKPDGRIRAGDEVLVQIVKEPIKTKLAGVTGIISLSGKYAVVGQKGRRRGRHKTSVQDAAPESEHSGEEGERGLVQVSSKLGKKYQMRFRQIEELAQIAEKWVVIVRTNAGELEDNGPLIQEAQELEQQLAYLMQIAAKRTCHSCLYRGKPEYLHFIENAYTAEYEEIVTDIPSVYEAAAENMADMDIPVRLYEDQRLALYKLYSLETRIQELLDKKVWLKSGGYLVIEPTEALISIDVNSGKYEQGRNQEEAALKVNLEAAEMIALHLRARNLSGMILVDFINLKKKANEQKLIEHMRSLLKKDSVTADVVDMTGLGLMEITRKKVNPSFREQYTQRC